MVASNKLIHLLEVSAIVSLFHWTSLSLSLQAFSSPWFLLASPDHHQLVFFLLEAFNNLIQYQFDGKCRRKVARTLFSLF